MSTLMPPAVEKLPPVAIGEFFYRTEIPQLSMPHTVAVPGVLGSLWFSVGVVQVLLFSRVLLSLVGLTKTPFVWFLYGATGTVVSPFREFFSYRPPLSGAHFDFPAVAAMGVFSLFAFFVTIAYLHLHMRGVGHSTRREKPLTEFFATSAKLEERHHASFT
ncbi:MAG: YggT family protein [Candidatus Sungbacteria bacterium]|nr:YggT family protein [Candidatus Sungbacteria bacterium]